MRRTTATVALLSSLLIGCSALVRPALPFVPSDAVRGVLTDWQAAGLSCGEPQVGMPGPAIDWVCRGPLAGVEVNGRLIADRFGVQSIHLGVPAATPGATAAAAFAALVRATSLVDAAEPEIRSWLIATAAAEGTMPTSDAIPRVHISPDVDGSPVLYLVPHGSSMLLAE